MHPFLASMNAIIGHVPMSDGTQRRITTPARMPAWARRNMRSKYQPHIGAKQNVKSLSRDYTECRFVMVRGEGYRDRPAPIICTLDAYARADWRDA